MRAAIYGAGSLGTILGAFISKNGGQIDLINHNEKHVAALREKGAHVVGTLDFTQKVTALTDKEMTGVYDIIFLMTKQQDNARTVTFLKDYLAEDGVIVTLQNGLPEPQIAEIVGEDRVLGCTVAWGATMLGPGVCELTSSPDSLTFSLGSTFKVKGNHFADVKALLEKMGQVEVDENFLGTRWSKLLINAAFSGMSAVLGCTFGEAANPKPSRRLRCAVCGRAWRGSSYPAGCIPRRPGPDAGWQSCPARYTTIHAVRRRASAWRTAPPGTAPQPPPHPGAFRRIRPRHSPRPAPAAA